MLKFARHRSGSADRSTPSPRPRPRTPSLERPLATQKPATRPTSPPPPLPSKSPLKGPREGRDDYEAISTWCLLPSSPASALRWGSCGLKSVLKRRYDFHQAVERLVQEKVSEVTLHLDTSSESGYGSDQDSLNAAASASNSASGNSNLAGSNSNVPPPPLPRRKPRKQVKFDSYVMLLQALRDRDAEAAGVHLDNVSDAALTTEEVGAAFLTAVVEGREQLVQTLLQRGFDANASADSAGLTGLHLAAAFNYLPIVRLLLSHGACVNALAHSSGKRPSDLCSRSLPGFQACHAYLKCMEECLGVANQGLVYAVQTYRTARADELPLNKGRPLNVVRKGDYQGSSWWWCTDQAGRQGYVLRDILALNTPTAL